MVLNCGQDGLGGKSDSLTIISSFLIRSQQTFEVGYGLSLVTDLDGLHVVFSSGRLSV
jgi:hypothetical protein